MGVQQHAEGESDNRSSGVEDACGKFVLPDGEKHASLVSSQVLSSHKRGVHVAGVGASTVGADNDNAILDAYDLSGK